MATFHKCDICGRESPEAFPFQRKPRKGAEQICLVDYLDNQDSVGVFEICEECQKWLKDVEQTAAKRWEIELCRTLLEKFSTNDQKVFNPKVRQIAEQGLRYYDTECGAEMDSTGL